MLIEKFKEFREVLSERISSPFVGSFIISWSISHWKVFAILFYNQDNITIQNRIDLLQTYLKGEGLCNLLLLPILYTTLILIAYVLLNSVGLFIKLCYEKWASPYVQKLLYNKSIVPTNVHERTKKALNTTRQELLQLKDEQAIIVNENTDIRGELDTLKSSTIYATKDSRISDVLHRDIEWENCYIYPDGRRARESFKVEDNSFILKNKKELQIENVVLTFNGDVLAFDKIIDGKVLRNILVYERSSRSFQGYENNDIKIIYKRVMVNIISATYGTVTNNIDVKEKIELAIAFGEDFTVGNSFFGEDPDVGNAKQLTIELNYNNSTNKISSGFVEGGKFIFTDFLNQVKKA